jgi:hypothetical protein
MYRLRSAVAVRAGRTSASRSYSTVIEEKVDWSARRSRYRAQASPSERQIAGSGGGRESNPPASSRRHTGFYLWLDATFHKIREGGRVISAATVVAVGGLRGRPPQRARGGHRLERGSQLLGGVPSAPPPGTEGGTCFLTRDRRDTQPTSSSSRRGQGRHSRDHVVAGVYRPPVFVKVPLSFVSPPHTMSSVPVHTPPVLPRALGPPTSSVAIHVSVLGVYCPPV